jgi:hypothetical protein
MPGSITYNASTRGRSSPLRKRGYKEIQREIKHLDISNVPELLRIAEEVRITHQPRILRRDSEDLAILMPVTPSSQRRVKRELTESDYQAFLSAAGSWSGLVDSDKLIEDIYESRRLSSKPPIEL